MGKLKGWILDTIYKMNVDDGTERTVFDENGYLYQRGTKLTISAAALNAITGNNNVTAVSSAQKACAVNGLSNITGGTGLADATLAAPTEGARATLRVIALTSGSVVVKTPATVTFDGTNNTATFDAVNDTIQLMYKSATEWAILTNTSVVLSST